MSESQAPMAVVLIIILLLIVGAIVAFVFMGNQNAGTTPAYNTGSNYPTTTTPTIPTTPSTGVGGTPGASCTTTSGFAGTYDCRGACLEKGYMDMSLENGYCDDMGASGLNLNCAAFNYDNGECNSAPTTPTTPTTPTSSWCTAGDTYNDGSFQGSTDGFYTFEGYSLCRATLSDETGTAYFYTNEDGSIWYLTDEYGTIALSHLDGTGGGTGTTGGTPSGTAIPVTVTGSYTIREWCPAAVGKIFKDLRKMPNSNIMFAYEYTTSGLVEWNGRLWCEHLANDPSNEAYYVYQNEAGVVELRQDSEGTFLDIEGAHTDYMLTLTVKSAPGATLAEDITFYTFVGEDVTYSYNQNGIEYCGADAPCLIQLSSISANRAYIEFTRNDYTSQQISPSIGQCENAYPLTFCTEEIVQRV